MSANLDVEIISTHIVTPSSPTPPHLTTFKFSLLNQIIRQEGTPVFLFYPPTARPPSPGLLKASLSAALTRFYPLAGRIINNSFILCTDQGAVYSEARVRSPIALFLQHPDATALKLITPVAAADQPILTVQVSRFSCGGIAICTCISHKIADAAAFATFLNSWGAAARNATDQIRGCVVESCHLFPPKPPSSLGTATSVASNSDQQTSITTKRFLVSPQKISALQKNLSAGGRPPSRAIALSALIWGVFIRITQRKNQTIRKHVVSHVIDMRKRTEPPSPSDCLNNLVESTMGIEWPGSETVDDSKLVEVLREGIRKYDDPEYVRRIHVDDTLLGHRRELVAGCRRGEVELLFFTSNLKVPYYETDFGQGRPSWAVSAVVPVKNVCTFMDAPSGGGVEVWMVLLHEDMEMVAVDPCFRSYADDGSSIVVRSQL